MGEGDYGDLTDFSVSSNIKNRKQFYEILGNLSNDDIKNWDLMTNECREMVSPLCLDIKLTKTKLIFMFDMGKETDKSIYHEGMTVLEEEQNFSQNVFDYLEKHGIVSKETHKIVIKN